MNPEIQHSNSDPKTYPQTPLPEAQPLPAPKRSVPKRWMFWLPLLAQTILILFVPVQATYTQATGKTVVLQTAPVDPYNPLQGYYVVLGYEISQPTNLEKVPGWKEVQASFQQNQGRSIFASDRVVYVILEAPKAQTTTPPKAWQAVKVQQELPKSLPENQVALQGRFEGGRLVYNLETYFIPEDRRDEINTRISELQWTRPPVPQPVPLSPNQAPQLVQKPPFVVEAKVGANGQAVPTGFWLKEQNYRF